MSISFKVKMYFSCVITALIIVFMAFGVVKHITAMNESKKAFKEGFLLVTEDVNKIEYKYNDVNNICSVNEMKAYLKKLNISKERFGKEISKIGGIIYDLTSSKNSRKVGDDILEMYSAYHDLVFVTDMYDKYVSGDADANNLNNDIEKINMALLNISQKISIFQRNSK